MKMLSNYGWLFPAILLATLLQNYHDLSALMSEGTLLLYQYEGPLFYKIIKDIIYLILMLVIIVNSLKNANLPFNAYSALFVLIVILMVGLSSLGNSLPVALYGLRWIFPLLIFMLMGNWYQQINTKPFLPIIIFGMACCLSVQIFQLFFMPPVFGEVLPGIPARTPGFFVAPNSAAFFGSLSAACVMVIAPNRLKLQFFSIAASIAICALTQSGTGLVASFLLALRFICRRHLSAFWFISLLIVLIVFPYLDLITGRDGYVELSGGGRIDALFKILSESALSITNFGVYTNTANLSSSRPEDQLAPDSLLAAWAGNFGLLATASFFIVLLFALFGMKKMDWGRAMPCVMVFAVFSMTTIVFEAFPMNLFLAFGLWTARRPSLT